MGNIILNEQVPDKIKWKGNADGKYTAKSENAALSSQNEMVDGPENWRTNAPLKVICFSWIDLHEACLTQDNLCRRKIHTDNRCYMCQKNIETNKAVDIWNMFITVFKS